MSISVSNLSQTDEYTSFTFTFADISVNTFTTYTKYTKIYKYNIRFRAYYGGNTSKTSLLLCQIHDEKCNPLFCLQDTVGISVEYNNLTVKKSITGPMKYNEEIHIVDNLNTISSIIFKIVITVSQPLNTLTKMSDDELFLDFKLVVKGSKKESKEESVGFHKAVLATWSPVLMNIFTNDWKEKNEGVLELPVTLEVLKALKEYIYKDELPKDRQTLMGLAELGSYYMDSQLELSASRAIFDIIRPEEMFETIEYSILKKTDKLSKFLLMKIKNLGQETFGQVIDSI